MTHWYKSGRGLHREADVVALHDLLRTIARSHQRPGNDLEKAEFEAYLKAVEAGNQENLYDPRLMITAGPGFKKIAGQP